MLLGLISDTHNQVQATRTAAETFSPPWTCMSCSKPGDVKASRHSPSWWTSFGTFWAWPLGATGGIRGTPGRVRPVNLPAGNFFPGRGPGPGFELNQAFFNFSKGAKDGIRAIGFGNGAISKPPGFPFKGRFGPQGGETLGELTVHLQRAPLTHVFPLWEKAAFGKDGAVLSNSPGVAILGFGTREP